MKKLIIIDLEEIKEEILDFEEEIIFWNDSFINKTKKGISILNFIEKNSDNIKSIYLNWIDKISNIEIDNLPIYEKLRIRGLYSYWWQTYFIEKSNFEHSPNINDAIKLIALQEWQKEKKISHIELHTKNTKLVNCFKDF